MAQIVAANGLALGAAVYVGEFDPGDAELGVPAREIVNDLTVELIRRDTAPGNGQPKERVMFLSGSRFWFVKDEIDGRTIGHKAFTTRGEAEAEAARLRNS